MLNCTRVDHNTVLCDGKHYHLEELVEPTDVEFWVFLLLYIVLVLFAGTVFRLKLCSTRTTSFNMPPRTNVWPDHGPAISGHPQSGGAEERRQA